MLSRQGSVSPEKRGILPSCFLEAGEDEKRDRDREKGTETGHGESQPKSVNVDARQAIVRSDRFSEKDFFAHEDGVDRKPSLLSRLSKQPLCFHLLLSGGKFHPDSVPTSNFTLGLTQQSSVRSSNPSVHATCSQSCSRGHLQAGHVAEPNHPLLNATI